jgi:hypothetical protein
MGAPHEPTQHIRTAMTRPATRHQHVIRTDPAAPHQARTHPNRRLAKHPENAD